MSTETLEPTTISTDEKSLRNLLEQSYWNQRKLDDRHVNYLAAQIESGKFADDASFHVAHLNGDAYLVNGQHTAHAFMKTGVVTKAVVLHTRCDSKRDVDLLYSRLDVGHRGRTFANVYHALGLDDKLTTKHLSKNGLAGAIKLIENNFNWNNVAEKKMDYETIAQRIAKWKPEIARYGDLLDLGEPRVIMRMSGASVLSVGLVILREEKDKAEKFIFNVAHRISEDQTRYDPCARLYDYLLSMNNVKNASANMNARMLVTREQLNLTTILAWNHFMNGTEMRVIRYQQEMRINSTKYKVKVK